ncbi:MAG: hypothetical protein MR357_07930, partial [Anaeroplasma sp.]|nr:hypothetical protein [Anaeroplasma sp.]
DDINYPIFKLDDLISIRVPQKLGKKDFVLYKTQNEYFVRRIIKYIDEDIYVAGDNEKEYHIIHKTDIVGKVISRERKNKRISFSINPKYKLYTFRKVNLAYFRLKNRTIDYEQEVINISLEKASITAQTLFQNKTEYKGSIDLDSELQSFINPDTLVLELKEAMENEALATKNALENAQNAILEEMANIKSNQSNEDENDEEVVDEIVEYVDEDGNPIDVEENDLEYENLEEKDE